MKPLLCSSSSESTSQSVVRMENVGLPESCYVTSYPQPSRVLDAACSLQVDERAPRRHGDIRDL